ncbi:MAG: hypothetical protein IJX78_02030 [Bacilli bacterium]|nr:hypothetical protein [Bacilli bacterium]
MKKTVLTIIILFISFILVGLLSAILNKPSIFSIGVMAILVIELLIKRSEIKKINRVIIPLAEQKDYQRIISYLTAKSKECKFTANEIACKLSIAQAISLKDGLVEAEKYIKENHLDNYSSSAYVMFVISLEKGKMEEALKYAAKVKMAKHKNANKQKEMLTRILKMIETKECDYIVLEETNYTFLQELCLKYKNNEEVEFDSNYNGVAFNIKLSEEFKRKRIINITIIGNIILAGLVAGLFHVGIINSVMVLILLMIVPALTIYYYHKQKKIITKNQYKIGINLGIIVLIILLICTILGIVKNTSKIKTEEMVSDMEYIFDIDIPDGYEEVESVVLNTLKQKKQIVLLYIPNESDVTKLYADIDSYFIHYSNGTIYCVDHNAYNCFECMDTCTCYVFVILDGEQMIELLKIENE